MGYLFAISQWPQMSQVWKPPQTVKAKGVYCATDDFKPSESPYDYEQIHKSEYSVY